MREYSKQVKQLIRHAIFARNGATDATRQELAAHAGLLIDLDQLYADLSEEGQR